MTGKNVLKKNLLSGVAGYYDCVIIDGISKATGQLLLPGNNFCGLARS